MSKNIIRGKYYMRGDLAAIAEVAGHDAALKIAVAFRGSYIYIHSMDGLNRTLRNERIKKEHAEGRSAKQIALKFGLSERQVKRIIRRRSEGGSGIIGHEERERTSRY